MGSEENVEQELQLFMQAADHMEKEGQLNDDERKALAQLCVKHGVDLPQYDEKSKELARHVAAYKESIMNPYTEPSEDDEVAKAVGAPRAANPAWRRRASVLYDKFDRMFNLAEKYEHQRSYAWHAAQYLALEEHGLLREGSESWLDLTKKCLEASRKTKAFEAEGGSRKSHKPELSEQ